MPRKRTSKRRKPTASGQLQQKDRLTKKLEDYPDVFADILNVLLFGRDVIDPALLLDRPTESIYKAETSAWREQRRDTLKYFGDAGIILAECGLENQARKDAAMPVRVMGYDYASYRRQLDRQAAGGTWDDATLLHPVITVVLNFSDRRWNSPKGLKEMLCIPDFLEPYVQDYEI